jgi:hypothetical protein
VRLTSSYEKPFERRPSTLLKHAALPLHFLAVGGERIQIKGRAYGDTSKSQKLSTIKLEAPCDTVLLALLDNTTMEPRQIWEGQYSDVCICLGRPGSKARERGLLSVGEFRSLACCIWEEGAATEKSRHRAGCMHSPSSPCAGVK